MRGLLAIALLASAPGLADALTDTAKTRNCLVECPTPGWFTFDDGHGEKNGFAVPPGSSTAGLKDLGRFSMSWYLEAGSLLDPDRPGDRIGYQFDLDELTSFSATFNDGTLASLSLTTLPVLAGGYKQDVYPGAYAVVVDNQATLYDTNGVAIGTGKITPTPEPATAALMILGAALFTGIAWRRRVSRLTSPFS